MDNLKFLKGRRGNILGKLILWIQDIIESESHFSQTQQSSHIMAIFQHYNNPFGVMQHHDLRRLHSINMANLNYGGKHNGTFIKITGQGKRK